MGNIISVLNQFTDSTALAQVKGKVDPESVPEDLIKGQKPTPRSRVQVPEETLNSVHGSVSYLQQQYQESQEEVTFSPSALAGKVSRDGEIAPEREIYTGRKKTATKGFARVEKGFSEP